MKTAISLLFVYVLLSFPFVRVFAQQDQAPEMPVNPDNRKITYRQVVEEPGTPEYLYDKAIGWFRYYYTNPNSVYRVQDRVNGKIEGYGRMRLYTRDSRDNQLNDAGIIIYRILVELKENRFRYTITDFNLKTLSEYPIEKWMNKTDAGYSPVWDSYLYQVDTVMQRLVSTMKEKMKPVVIKKDEW